MALSHLLTWRPPSQSHGVIGVSHMAMFHCERGWERESICLLGRREEGQTHLGENILPQPCETWLGRNGEAEDVSRDSVDMDKSSFTASRCPLLLKIPSPESWTSPRASQSSGQDSLLRGWVWLEAAGKLSKTGKTISRWSSYYVLSCCSKPTHGNHVSAGPGRKLLFRSGTWAIKGDQSDRILTVHSA